jgi:succinate dehydrogenase hydrophobic anchor subunit
MQDNIAGTLGPVEARRTGLKHAAIGVVSALSLPLVMSGSLEIIWIWYLPWLPQIVTAIAVIALVVWSLAPWVAWNVARNPGSFAPPFLAALALVSGVFAGSAVTLIRFRDEAGLPDVVMGPLTGILFVGLPACLLFGSFYRSELSRRTGQERG